MPETVPRLWESVAPIVPLCALPNRVSPIGPGVTLDTVPPWFKRERQYAEKDFGKREAFSAEACLRATFEADGLGAPCLGPGGRERKNHEVSWELIRIANLALWLARPSALHLELVVTAEPEPSPRGSAIIAGSLESIRPHENYAEASLKCRDLAMADKLATSIQKLNHPSSVWTATRFLWLALTEEVWETRYVNLWVAIEALFGPESGRDVSKKLRMRVAKFLNTDNREAEVARELVRKGYAWRSAAVHGSRFASLNSADASDLMLTTEGIVLTTLRKVLSEEALTIEFCSPSRDIYLDALTKGFQP